MHNFKANIAQVADAAAVWIEQFKQLPNTEKARTIAELAASFWLAKPIGAVHMKMLGAGLGAGKAGALKIVKKIGDFLKKNPEFAAATPEGFIFKAAEEIAGIEGATEVVGGEGIMLEEVQDVAKAGKEVVKDGVKAGETVQWTPHGHKHFPSKAISWKEIVSSTKVGDAMYHPSIDIEKIERFAWEKGTLCTNGKTWKVMKFDTVIGAIDGIETNCVLIKWSANTVHGHPISPAKYAKFIK